VSQATKGYVSLLWRIPLVAIGLTLCFFAFSDLPLALAVALIGAGALSIASGFVRSGNRYLPTIVVIALVADCFAGVAFLASLLSALGD
jgi:hypothetical protein